MKSSLGRNLLHHSSHSSSIMLLSRAAASMPLMVNVGIVSSPYTAAAAENSPAAGNRRKRRRFTLLCFRPRTRLLPLYFPYVLRCRFNHHRLRPPTSFPRRFAEARIAHCATIRRTQRLDSYSACSAKPRIGSTCLLAQKWSRLAAKGFDKLGEGRCFLYPLRHTKRGRCGGLEDSSNTWAF